MKIIFAALDGKLTALDSGGEPVADIRLVGQSANSAVFDLGPYRAAPEQPPQRPAVSGPNGPGLQVDWADVVTARVFDLFRPPPPTESNTPSAD